DMADPVLRRSIHDHYVTDRPVVVTERPVVHERHVHVDRHVAPPRQGMSVLAGILVVCLVLGLAWMTFLVSTRGWDQARQDIKSSLQGAVYAAKETSLDAALTTKVKTALSLSKRVP